MKTKILIVEDDSHILLGLEELLKSDDVTASQKTMIEQQIAELKAHANTAPQN